MKDLKPGFQYVDKEEIRLSNIDNMLVMGDIGCTSLSAQSKAVLSEIFKIETDLFFVLGDLVRFGRVDEFEELINFCDNKASVPIFALIGNHDIPSYPKYLGRAQYSLVMNDTVIIVLDNITLKFKDGKSDFLERQLSRHKGKNILIFFHIPPPTDLAQGAMPEEEWNAFKNISDKYKEQIKAIFCAHIHGFREYYLDGYHIFITGGGGAELQDLEKDVLKSHHVIKINIKPAISFEIIKIGTKKKSETYA